MGTSFRRITYRQRLKLGELVAQAWERAADGMAKPTGAMTMEDVLEAMEADRQDGEGECTRSMVNYARRELVGPLVTRTADEATEPTQGELDLDRVSQLAEDVAELNSQVAQARAQMADKDKALEALEARLASAEQQLASQGKWLRQLYHKLGEPMPLQPTVPSNGIYRGLAKASEASE